MATTTTTTETTTTQIHVRGSLSPASGRVWTVFAESEEQAIYTGEDAREHAIEAALRLAETIRAHTAVLVIIESSDEKKPVGRIARSRRLAS